MMSKPIIIDTTCPGCKKDHPVAIPIEDLNIAIGRVQHDEPVKPDIAKMVADEVERRVPKAKPEDAKPKEEKRGPKIPSHIKKYKCKNCGKLHENKDFEGLPKGKCDTCNAHFTSRSKGKCPYCKDGEIEGIDDNDIESMGLYTQQVEDEDEEDEHEGHDHS